MYRTEYGYDVDGNLTSDRNKGINSISYNHLNLPTRITTGDGTVDYVYDAIGTKLKKVVDFLSIPTNTKIYDAGFIYTNDVLSLMTQPEGYVESDGNGSFTYAYNYIDHLGNVRLTYADTDGNGSINPATEIISEKNYYPFGLQHKGYNNVIQNENSVAQNFGYNGKENNPELGIEWMDFGARNYDAALGRWMNIDPLAEMSFNLTPYRFAGNNPVLFKDPNGLWEFTFDSGSGILSLNRQEGDSYDSFLEQTGLSRGQAKKLFGVGKKELEDKLNGGADNFAVKGLNGDSKHGKLLQGIETALSSGNLELSKLPVSQETDENTCNNCFNTTRNLSQFGSVDAQAYNYLDPFGMANGFAFDKELGDNYRNIPEGKRELGDAVRWSKDGVKVEHGSIFLLNNKDGVHMFTKNGHMNSQLYEIMLQSDIISTYGKSYGSPKGRQQYEAQVPTADGGTKTETKSDRSAYYRPNN